MKLLGDLFGELKAVKEAGEPLLDRTMILYGSNLGNANTHVTRNLPVRFAGGGFHYGQHLAFSTTIDRCPTCSFRCSNALAWRAAASPRHRDHEGLGAGFNRNDPSWDPVQPDAYRSCVDGVWWHNPALQ